MTLRSPHRDRIDGRLRRRHRAGTGMTLIELLVVLAIVVGLMAGGFYYMGVMTHSTLRSESMRLTSALKYTWTQAAMNSAQYRMVFDLENDRYWTEVTRSPVAPDEDDETDEESEQASQQFVSKEAREAERKERESRADDEETQNPFNTKRQLTYRQVKDAALQPRKLPPSLGIKSVIKGGQESPTEKGRAAIRFFPNGFQEPAIIKLTETSSGAVYSLVTEPLTGRVHIHSRDLEQKEGFGEPVERED